MSDLLDAFELTEGEKLSPLWARLKAHLETQLKTLRAKNDRTQTEVETARLRGHIECLKAIVALGDDRPQTGE